MEQEQPTVGVVLHYVQCFYVKSHFCFLGHLLLNLSHGKEDFLKETVESFANTVGLLKLFECLSGRAASRESSFLGTDEMGNVSTLAPMQEELSKYDIGKGRYLLKLSCSMAVSEELL